MAILRQAPDRQRIQHEGDEHGLLPADLVGDPAEQWPRQPVQDIVDHERHGQHRSGNAEQTDRNFGDAEIRRDGGELRGDDQAAGGNHDEHHIQQPEQGRLQHFPRSIVALRLWIVDHRRRRTCVDGARRNWETITMTTP